MIVVATTSGGSVVTIHTCSNRRSSGITRNVVYSIHYARRDMCPSTSAATNSPPSRWKALGASVKKAAT